MLTHCRKKPPQVFGDSEPEVIDVIALIAMVGTHL
jgi:hypothetical protein